MELLEHNLRMKSIKTAEDPRNLSEEQLGGYFAEFEG